jgi:hypothetical protein
MRTTLGTLLILGLAAGPLAAADRDMALAVIEQAIKAHGGADALTRAQTAVRTSTGTMSLFGKDLAFTDEMTWQLPDRFRLVIDVGTGQDRTHLTLVVNPDKGWQATGGMVVDLGPDRLEELHEEAYVLWLTTLTPLRKTGFELTPLPDAQVGSRQAAVVKVASKGHADARLYFDKDSGLLIKLERRAKEAGLAVDKEYLYGEPKDFDGAKLPTKLQETINGKRFTDLTNISYKFPRGVNDAVFARP